MNNAENNLLKQDNGENGKLGIAAKIGGDKCAQTQKAMKVICQSLLTSSQDYKPEATKEAIERFINSEVKLDRILYSEISNFIFSLDSNDRGIFNTNIDNLLQYSQQEGFVDQEDVRKIIVKIYDHSQLAVHQIENAGNIAAKSIEETKSKINEEFKDELKKIEREYITILGIFASIVIAFVAAITVSSSVLQNIAATSVYRLLLVVDLLIGSFLCAIHILIRFILVINDKEKHIIGIWYIVNTCIGFALIIIIAWFIDFRSAQTYFIHNWEILPWKK